MQIRKRFNNLMGELLGYEKCVFCGDRANWKPWMGAFNVDESKEGVKKVEYEPPVCNDCFWEKSLDAVINAVKVNITEDNNICRKLGVALIYSDCCQEHIIAAIVALKGKKGGT